MTEAVALLAWLSCLEESHISFLFNHQLSLSVIGEPELICDRRACHILCLSMVSSAGAGCMANPEGTAGPAKPGQCLTGPSTAGPHFSGVATPWGCQLHMQLPAGLSLQCLEEHNSTAQIFLPTCFHEFTLKACFLKKFFYLFKMCCFHRLHLLLRILSTDKRREDTEPAPQVPFP